MPILLVFGVAFAPDANPNRAPILIASFVLPSKSVERAGPLKIISHVLSFFFRVTVIVESFRRLNEAIFGKKADEDDEVDEDENDDDDDEGLEDGEN